MWRLALRSVARPLWIPAFAGMTVVMHSTRTRESMGVVGIIPIFSNPPHHSSKAGMAWWICALSLQRVYPLEAGELRKLGVF